jgi:hypothetical protein
VIKLGVIIEIAFNTKDKKSNSIIKTIVFLCRKSSSTREISKESLYINYNIIYL